MATNTTETAIRNLAANIRSVLEAKRMQREARNPSERRIANHAYGTRLQQLQEHQAEFENLKLENRTDPATQKAELDKAIQQATQTAQERFNTDAEDYYNLAAQWETLPEGEHADNIHQNLIKRGRSLATLAESLGFNFGAEAARIKRYEEQQNTAQKQPDTDTETSKEQEHITPEQSETPEIPETPDELKHATPETNDNADETDISIQAPSTWDDWINRRAKADTQEQTDPFAEEEANAINHQITPENIVETWHTLTEEDQNTALKIAIQTEGLENTKNELITVFELSDAAAQAHIDKLSETKDKVTKTEPTDEPHETQTEN